MTHRTGIRSIVAVLLVAAAAAGCQNANAGNGRIEASAGNVADQMPQLQMPQNVTQVADVAFPIHARVSAPDVYWNRTNGQCTAAPVHATAVDARGRVIDPRLINWQSTDTTLLAVDTLGVVRIVTCDFHDRQAGIVATVRRVEFDTLPDKHAAQRAKAAVKLGVRS